MKWSLLSGIITFTIAIVLLMDWGHQLVAMMSLLVGINLLFNGFYVLIFAFNLQSFEPVNA